MKIVVTSNCQTAGVALGLRLFFPGATIRAIPLPATGNTIELEKIHRELADTDYWITSGNEELGGEDMQFHSQLQIFRIPVISFQAFHPDLCYARRSSTHELTTLHYNSAIVVWGYINGYPVDAVARLFNETVFDKLGYFDYWDVSKKHLHKLFMNSDLGEAEFSRFFLSIQRRGVFMHSINHAKMDTLVDLARLIALRMGYSGSIWDIEAILPDALVHDMVWPVYPEIGHELGIAGSYIWKMRQDFIEGVAAYATYAYGSYCRQGMERHNFEIVGSYHGWDYQKLHEVLSQNVEN